MVIWAVQMAVWQRQGSDEVILHSDRGSRFRSGDYQRYLAANGLICSMSAAGDCRDNAARADVFDYIERPHNPRERRRVVRQNQKVATLLESSVISG